MTYSANTFAPTASWEMLRLRSAMLKKVRDFFYERNYLEVETPLLSHDSVIDLHLDPLSVTLFTDATQPAQGETLWLQTSPEFGMKRLLAAGSPSIFQICKAFRGAEQGAWHNPEFTMVEWYGVGDNYEQGMQLLADLAEYLLSRGAANRISYRQAFLQFTNIDPFQVSLAEIQNQLPDIDCYTQPKDWLLDLLLTRHVQPHLGQQSPTILYDYPAEQAALAKTQIRNGQAVAQRFELYINGLELANGYHELTQADILRQRNLQNNVARKQAGKNSLPEESNLLAAMEQGLPACAGCALGFDRLLMVATGAKQISEVMAFPVERA
jgi:elongation factor P--(R)-beta-lysine ligase